MAISAPVAIAISAGIAALSTAATIVTSQQQAEEQQKIAKNRAEAEANAREADALQKYQQLEENRRQTSMQDAKEAQSVQQEARRAIATQRTASAESGLSGIGKLSLEQTIGMKEVMDLSTIKKRANNADVSYKLQGRAIQQGGETLPAYYGSTSMGAGMAALSIGLAGAGGAMSGYAATNKTTVTKVVK